VRETNNLHVADTEPLVSPRELKRELPISGSAAELVGGTRDRIRAILAGEDPRLLLVVGPCSIHDVAAAREYAEAMVDLRERHGEGVEVIMRVYFEKPRSTTGWKGLINDPHLDGSHDMNRGLRLARRLLLDLAEMGLAAGTEMLDPITPQYLADVVAWGAIGARTSESQTHREMVSGLSMPTGFKNSTDGTMDAAINGMIAARHPHRFLGIDRHGHASMVRTTGNPDTHLVLRGGARGPNYGPEHVAEAEAALAAAGVCPRVMIDCSHGNSAKDHRRQHPVASEIARQVADGCDAIVGAMIESHLVAGKQAFPAPAGERLVHGQSITDACVDLATTAAMVAELSESAAAARAGAA